MSTALVKHDAAGLSGGMTEEQVALIKRTIAKDASNDELALFINQCNRTGLDPFARQIYSIKRGSERVTQVSIDGARLVAERSGKYRPGFTYWYDAEGKECSVWLKDEHPAAARVTLFKDGHEVPGIPVKWSERVQNTSTWKTMPATMLAKCAEMATLRQAFPQELSGLYSTEEMGNDPPPIPRAELVEKNLVKAEVVEASAEGSSFAPPAGAAKATKKQVTDLQAELDRLAEGDVSRDALEARLYERYGTVDLTELSKAQADELLERLKGAS